MKIEFRKPVRNANGGIDCEVNHPVLGWVPFTARHDDPTPHGRAIYDAIKFII